MSAGGSAHRPVFSAPWNRSRKPWGAIHDIMKNRAMGRLNAHTPTRFGWPSLSAPSVICASSPGYSSRLS